MTDIKVTKDFYVKGGFRYDRVTAILGYFSNPKLVRWKLTDKEAKTKEKTAKQIGTRVHNLTLEYDKGKAVRLTPNDSQGVKNCMEAYKRFVDIEKPTYIQSEYAVFNDRLRIAGTMDRKLATKEILDIKTSERIRLDYWLQLAMYNWLDGESCERLAVVRLDKFTGEYEYKVIPYSRALVNVFLGIYEYYRFLTCNIKEKEEDNGEITTHTKISNRLALREAEDIDSWAEWNRQV